MNTNQRHSFTAGIATILVVVLLLLFNGSALAAYPTDSDANQPGNWEDQFSVPASCVKYEAGVNGDLGYYSGAKGFVIDASGVLALIVKAGTVNDVYLNPTNGNLYMARSGKDISHVIVCTEDTTSTPSPEPSATPSTEPSATPTPSSPPSSPTPSPTPEVTFGPEPSFTPLPSPSATPTSQPSPTPTATPPSPTSTPTPPEATPRVTMPPTDTAETNSQRLAQFDNRLFFVLVVGLVAWVVLMVLASAPNRRRR